MKLWSLFWTLQVVKGTGWAACGRRGQGGRGTPAQSVAGALGLSGPRLAGLRNTRQQLGLRFVFMNRIHFARATKKKEEPATPLAA